MQETWLDNSSDLSLSISNIDNNSCIAKRKYCTAHSGLIIYLHNRYVSKLGYEIEMQCTCMDQNRVSLMVHIRYSCVDGYLFNVCPLPCQPNIHQVSVKYLTAISEHFCVK